MNKKINNKGFTLIELLIVISIIGVLSTLLMNNFIGIRQRARDGKRKADISQIQAALEQYRSDQGAYPTSLTPCGTSLLSPDGTVTYIQKISCDPSSDNSSYYNSGNYYYTSSGATYTLAACLENTADSQGTTTSPGGSGCTSSPPTYYVVNNP